MSEPERGVPMTVRVEPSLRERLDQAARADDRPPTVLARKLIREGLDRLEGGAARERIEAARR